MGAWAEDFAGMQQEMFYGEVPGFAEVLDVVQRFENEFNTRGDTTGQSIQ